MYRLVHVLYFATNQVQIAHGARADWGEASLQRALIEFIAHFHSERNHQGKGNLLLFLPRPCRFEDAPPAVETSW
jgi:hypothetical protein